MYPRKNKNLYHTMAVHVYLTIIAALLHLTLATPTPIPSKRSSTGCGKPPFLPGLTQYRFNLISSGKSRSYSYHLPASYDPDTAYPVVLGFHGSSSIGAFFELDTKMSASRYSGEKIMLYPNGMDGSWAGPSYHENSSSTVEEDVQFIADVVADAKARFCVDEEKVFGVGMSNGGGFVNSLACSDLSNPLFAALATHSGAFYTDTNGPNNGCTHPKPIPMLSIHGAADKTVPYTGGDGDGGPLPAIQDWLGWWTERNACTTKRTETLYDGKVLHESWICEGKEGFLQHYKIAGLGHCWADTEPNISQLTVPQLPSVMRSSE
ncbi:alpha/beta-hydrolase, partial [Decorospora gaudefroyi]